MAFAAAAAAAVSPSNSTTKIPVTVAADPEIDSNITAENDVRRQQQEPDEQQYRNRIAAGVPGSGIQEVPGSSGIQNSAAATLLAAPTTEPLADDVLLDELSARFQGVLPIQPSPLLLAPDHTPCSLKSTLLNGHLIYCFVIGGECRLCFPQIISVVLQGIRMNEVNDLFLDLNIHISVANPQQLDTLKLAGVMPMTADSCGLVTKSDAERLVAKLLPQSSGPLPREVSRADALPVCHDCFGGCTGTLLPSAPTDERIECTQCKLMFSGERFVAHSHSTEQIRRVCHWGFDSSNWRHYLHLPEHCEDDLKALQRLEMYKYPPVRLGKRPAPNGTAKVLENIVCSKMANLATTAAATMTASATIPSVPSVDEINEQFLKFRAAAAAAAVATVAGASDVPPAAPTVAQGAPVLPAAPESVPASAGAAAPPPPAAPFVTTGFGNQTSPGSLLIPQLQSLFALQFTASQLPLAEQFSRLPGPNPFLLAASASAGARWKTDFESQFATALQPAPAAVPPPPPLPANKEKQTGVEQSLAATATENVTLFGTDEKTIPSDDSTIPAASLTNKTGISLEKLLDGTLKEPAVSLAQALLAEYRHEKECLQSENKKLRHENALLRTLLAGNTMWVGLKDLATVENKTAASVS